MLSFFLCLVNIDIEKRAAIYSSISIANKNVSISSKVVEKRSRFDCVKKVGVEVSGVEAISFLCEVNF